MELHPSFSVASISQPKAGMSLLASSRPDGPLRHRGAAPSGQHPWQRFRPDDYDPALEGHLFTQSDPLQKGRARKTLSRSAPVSAAPRSFCFPTAIRIAFTPQSRGRLWKITAQAEFVRISTPSPLM